MSNYKLRSIIKGDQKISCISAASIIAKVTRDKMMLLNLDKNLKFTIGKKIMVMEQNII